MPPKKGRQTPEASVRVLQPWCRGSKIGMIRDVYELSVNKSFAIAILDFRPEDG